MLLTDLTLVSNCDKYVSKDTLSMPHRDHFKLSVQDNSFDSFLRLLTLPKTLALAQFQGRKRDKAPSGESLKR